MRKLSPGARLKQQVSVYVYLEASAAGLLLPPPPHFLDGIGTEKLAGNNAFFHLFFFLRSSSSFFSFSLSFSYFRKKKERKKEKFEIPHSYVFFCVLLRACMCLVGGGGVG